MKKTLCVLLAVVVTLCFSGCGVLSSGNSSGEGGTTPPPVGGSDPAVAATYTPCDYYYSELNDNGKKIYEAVTALLREGKLGYAVDVSDYGITYNINDKSRAVEAVRLDDPLNFLSLLLVVAFDTDGKKITLNITLDNVLDDVEYAAEQFKPHADAIISEAAKLATDYEKVLYIHDWIVDNTVFNSEAVSGFQLGMSHVNYATGPIVYNDAVCEGYARAFQYLCLAVGVNCVCVPGIATNSAGSTERHMWNKVQLDGSWYNVDPTWDDPLSLEHPDTDKLKWEDRLNGGYVTLEEAHHIYFLISDEHISKNHTETREYGIVPPAANNDYPR